QDGPAGTADLPEHERFGKIGDGERVHAALHQGAGHLCETVAVSVGFDDGHEFCPANPTADGGDIVAERVEVHFDPTAVVTLRRHFQMSLPDLESHGDGGGAAT